MSKPTTLIILGALVALVPLLGVPGSWKTAIFAVLGVAIAALAILLRQETPRKERHDTFVENETETAEYATASQQQAE